MNDLVTIDWNLGNSCNLKCNYCNWELYDGSNPFPAADKLIPAFVHVIEQTRDFSRVNIEFSGGEPTQSEAIQQVILDNKEDRIKFKLVSNAQPSLDWWSNTVHHLYDLTLSYHASSNFDHFFEVVKIASNCLRPKIYIPLTPQSWDNQVIKYEQLKSLDYDVRLQMLYSNFTKGNNEYLKYSEDQWELYYQTQGIDIHAPKQVESTIEFKRVNNLNNFHGHLCWAGTNQFVIDNFGDAWRGWCKSTRCLGNVFDKTLTLEKTPQVCPKIQCRNGFDLNAAKSQKSWGLS